MFKKRDCTEVGLITADRLSVSQEVYQASSGTSSLSIDSTVHVQLLRNVARNQIIGGVMVCVTLRGSWVAEKSSLHSHRAILKRSNLNCFEAVCL